MQRDAGLGLTVGDDEVPAGCVHQINVSIFAPFRILSLAHRGRRLVSAQARRSSGSSGPVIVKLDKGRSEEHTSELQSLMRISYAVFCLKKKKQNYCSLLQVYKMILILTILI